MKKSIVVLAVSTLIGGGILISCNTPAEKVENAENKVAEANSNLDSANAAYLADIENYRKETAAKIAANEKSVAEFNARIESEKNETRADYKKKIAELNKKNSDMKKRMDDYKADGKDKWQIFKAEFSHDMDGLGKAFKDLTVKNIK
ncbi:hypothetical protein GALL_121100 [mine drainage metagenome]|uniref:Chromosome partition protein Smc n=1 Tax=mine drainage metagenome TaxID=410659 RepID=A0A1J5SCJ0_9ZZZZ